MPTVRISREKGKGGIKPSGEKSIGGREVAWGVFGSGGLSNELRKARSRSS